MAALGVTEVDVLTHRAVAAVASPIHSARLVQFGLDDNDPSRNEVETPNGPEPLAGFLAAHDIIVNCVLQDPNRPMMFLDDQRPAALASGHPHRRRLVRRGHGVRVGPPDVVRGADRHRRRGREYYGVDHSPSYLWDSATWEISEALLPHLATVLAGPTAWAADPTISRAVEIEEGRIRNPSILEFQSRSAEFPHLRRT